MTLAKALVTQAGPYMLASKANIILEAETAKGCIGNLLTNPVAIEPAYSPITVPKDIKSLKEKPSWTYEIPPSKQDLRRFQVWMSPDQPFDWNCLELFLKQLLLVCNRVGLEIMGNQDRIVVTLLCHKQDTPVVTTAFYGKLKFCRLSPLAEDIFSEFEPGAWEDVRFYDYFPEPPYSHLLTRPCELQTSPYECLITALANIPAPAKGLFQVLFQPVSPANNWHRNIEILLDLEYIVKLVANMGQFQRFAQQAPSGDLHQMAGEVETKAHNDKPLFSAAFRIALLGADNLGFEYLQSLAVFTSVFQHGGRGLQYITESDYKPLLSPQQIRDMFETGLTYRPGFLVNSAELVGLAHFPPAAIVENLNVSIDVLDTLAVVNNSLSEGTLVGTCNVAGECQKVCIPENKRVCHTHLIGKPGKGKSTLEEHMILHDIKSGHGVAVLDPHGDMAERLLGLIGEEFVDKVIYFDPSDPDWVPLWNLMQNMPGQDNGRMADDLIGVLKGLVSGWGDRMEHILRHSIFALLHLSGSTLLDIADLLRSGSKESDATRQLIMEVVQNEEARKFWQNDFGLYRKDELTPAKHKLSKLLVGGTVSLMLSQPYSRFNFRRIMDDGMIFIGNLSGLGTEMRDMLGGFMLAAMYTTTLSRRDMPREIRRPFHIYLDEAHRFVTDSLEDTIAETRKYGVSLTLAHQYMRQFNATKMGALASVGTTVVFNVDTQDASLLSKSFRGLVKVEDIVNLEVGQAIIRCDTDIARIQTLTPLEVPQKNFKSQIIAQSRKNYCMPVPQVRRIIKNRGQRNNRPLAPLDPLTNIHEEMNTQRKRYYEEH